MNGYIYKRVKMVLHVRGRNDVNVIGEGRDDWYRDCGELDGINNQSVVVVAEEQKVSTPAAEQNDGRVLMLGHERLTLRGAFCPYTGALYGNWARTRPG